MTACTLGGFVLARLAEDLGRAASGKLPNLEEAERQGLFRFIRTDDGCGLLVVAGPVEVRGGRDLVPFGEKVALIRWEVHHGLDARLLGLIAAAYDDHEDWLEDWRP